MARTSFRASRSRGPGFKYLRHLRSLIAALNLPSLRVIYATSVKKYMSLVGTIRPPVPASVAWLTMLWFRCVIYFWVIIPYSTISFFWSLSITMLYSISRSSPSIKKFLIHASAIGEVLEHMFAMLTETSLSILAINGIQIVFDVFSSWIDAYVSTGFQQDSGVPSMTFAELSDLLYYEELSDEEDDFGQPSYLNSIESRSRLSASFDSQANMRRRMRKHMHQYIPPRIFRAKVRIKSETSTSVDSIGGTDLSPSMTSSGGQGYYILYQLPPRGRLRVHRPHIHQLIE